MARTRHDPWRLPAWFALGLVLGLGGLVRGGPDEDDGSFRMTPPVACKEIRGYEDFVPLEPAALTSDEKLLVYFRPLHFKTARKGALYEAHFTEEGRIRRKGGKAVVWAKKDLLEYRPRADPPPR